jgi:MFS family permease
VTFVTGVHQNTSDMPDSEEGVVAHGNIELELHVDGQAGVLKVDQPPPPNFFRKLLPAFICVFVDFFGYGVSIPILPFFALELGATSTEVGFIIGVYSLAQLIGNVVMGNLSDRVGRKPVIIASLVASTISYIFCGMVQTVPMLLLSRVFAGICGGTMPVAQAMVMDTVTDFKERPKYIGYCGSMLGLAFTIGPGIGAGITAASSFRSTFFATAGICGAMTIYAAVTLVETKVVVKEESQKKKQVVASDQKWGGVIWGTSFAFFLASWSFFVMCSVGSLAWRKIYGWGTTEMGIILVFAGVIQVVNEAFLAKKLIANYGAINVAMVTTLGLSATTLFTFMVHVPVPHLILQALMCSFWGLLKSPVIVVVGQYAPPAARGAAIGVLLGCMSLGFAVGPFVSGATFDVKYTPLRSSKAFSYLPFVIGCAVGCLAVITMAYVKACIKQVEAKRASASH